MSQGEYPKGNPQPSRTPKLQAAKATRRSQKHCLWPEWHQLGTARAASPCRRGRRVGRSRRNRRMTKAKRTSSTSWIAIAYTSLYARIRAEIRFTVPFEIPVKRFWIKIVEKAYCLHLVCRAIFISNMNSADLENEIISNQVKILDKDQCSSISGKGLKKKVVGYRIVWKYGFIQKYGWVLKPKVVGGHVSFSQWQYVKGYYSVWGKYKVKEPIYKYYFVSDESLTSTTVKNNKK